MKVLRLVTENFMRVRAVDITPGDHVVKVSGKNAEGKTSVLNSIWAAFQLRSVLVDEPIREGAKKAVIRLSMGEIAIERVITKKGQELKVTLADGSDVKSPQKFLDAMIGELSFDPLAFDRMRPQDQCEALRKAVKIDFDFLANEVQRQKCYEKRTNVSRDAKQKRAEAESIEYTPGVPQEPVDTKAILDRIQQAGEHNASIDQRKQKRASVLHHAETYEGNAERLRAKIAGLQAELADSEAQAKTARERLAAAPPLPAPIDISEERRALEGAEEINRAIEKNQRRALLEGDAMLTEARAEELTAEIERLEAEKRAAVGAAKMPVEGLTLGEDMVMFKGHPYAQASAAERLRVSMAIAISANPKIRVIRISDGSLLDSASMAIIKEMCQEHDFQCWLELVNESGKIGFYIEDGMVAKVNK